MLQIETRTWARWLASFVGFPLAGLAARAVAGPIDSATAAVAGGLAAGAALGAVQALAQRTGTAERVRWAAATAIGLAAGLAVGAAAVGYRTDAASLVAMGAASGAGVGLVQALAWRAPLARRLLWAAGTPALWALGWLITSQVIVDADRHFATFGASGAIVVTAASGLLLAATHANARTRRAAMFEPRAVR